MIRTRVLAHRGDVICIMEYMNGEALAEPAWGIALDESVMPYVLPITADARLRAETMGHAFMIAGLGSFTLPPRHKWPDEVLAAYTMWVLLGEPNKID